MGIDQLIERSLQNDAAAKRGLYDIIAPSIMGVCRRYTKSKFEADDVFQDAFVKIFNNLHQFDVKKGVFQGWSYKIAVNSALQHLSSNGKIQNYDIDEVYESDAVSVELDDELDFKELQSYIDQLPDQQRIAFNLFAIEGYSHKEIATLLKINEGTSKSNVSKARGKLMQMHIKRNKISVKRIK